jgi:hypothetical protein
MKKGTSMGYSYMTFELLFLVIVWPFLLIFWLIIDARSSMPFIEELESSKKLLLKVISQLDQFSTSNSEENT